MKLEKLNDDNLIVFLNKFYIDKYKFSLDKNLEECFKELFKVLSAYHGVEISGYYNISVYQDNIYGCILCIEREDIDFYNYYDDHIDMKISIVKNNRFIFKVNDNSVIDKRLLKYIYLIIDNNDIYLMPKRTISQYDLGRIIENSKIIFGAKANDILDRCKYINTSKVFV